MTFICLSNMIDIYNEINIKKSAKNNFFLQNIGLIDPKEIQSSMTFCEPCTICQIPSRLWKSLEKYLESFSLHWNGSLGKY